MTNTADIESIAHVRAPGAAIAELLDANPADLSWQQEFYTWMHSHPELSECEEKTAIAIRERLSHYNCTVSRPIGGHGLVATISNGEGPTILSRADFDALPVTEDTGAPYASTVRTTGRDGNETGVMHACGHDMHTTALLGAVAILDATRQRWSGTFHALFQPAEEVTAGAGAMVRDGLADEISRPDLCLGQHIVPGKAGTIMSMPGPALAACDSITVTIHGTSAHASSPHQSVDPIYVAAHVILRLQGIVGREVDPGEFAVVSVGQIHAGNTNNSIPDTATLTLNCRFYNTGVRDHVYRAIERVIRAECEASGCPAEPDIEYWAHGELTDNDPAVFSHVRETFDAVFGDSSIDAERWTASEDFSEIPRHFDVPYLFWTAGITPDEQWEKRDETPVPANHMATFLPDLSTISSTTKAAAAAPLSFLFKE